MDLKEFIKTAIADVTNAIGELQCELNNGAIVNPTLPNAVANTTLAVDGEVRRIERLDFDVAVTASEASKIDGGAKAGISVFGAKIDANSSAEEQHVSRLTFSIPVVFPVVHVKTPAEISKERRLKRPQYDD